jgi:hypothetical protein
MTHALGIQGALIAKIKTLATEAAARVYDTVPRDTNGTVTAVFPFVSLGSSDELPIDEECWDRTETTQEINIWSRAVGMPECKRISALIRAALHEQDLIVAGNTVDRMRVNTINYSRDPDGITNRARITLQVDTQPV